MTPKEARTAGREGSRALKYQRIMTLDERKDLAERLENNVRLVGSFDCFADPSEFVRRMDHQKFMPVWMGSYDFVSCNLVLHYAFISEEVARNALANIASCLAPGGVTFGITIDGSVMAHRYAACIPDAEGIRHWSLEDPCARQGPETDKPRHRYLCSCKFPEWNMDTPFGHECEFTLYDSKQSPMGEARPYLVSSPECAVYFPVLVRLAAEVGLVPLDHTGRVLAPLKELRAHDWVDEPGGPIAIWSHDPNIMEFAVRSGMRLSETHTDIHPVTGKPADKDGYDVTYHINASQWEGEHTYSVFSFMLPLEED